MTRATSTRRRRVVTINPPFPDLAITKSHLGSVVTGTTLDYTIGLTNSGKAATTATITVTDTLPAGLVFSGSSGTGWSCDGSSPPVVTCTNAGPVAANGDTAPDLTITVLADGSVTGSVTNEASVSTAGDPNAANNSADDPTNIIQAGIDLQMAKTHDGDLFFGENATYRLDVANVGTLPATATIRVTDPIPAGTSFVSASGGGTWVCNLVSGEVRCFTNNDLAAGSNLQDIVITVTVSASAPDSISNTATVTVDGDALGSNNSDTDVAVVSALEADLTISKVHPGTFVVGEPDTYSILVRNVGSHTAGTQITVTDELPAGIGYDGSSGDGWSCSAAGQTVTCTHDGNVEPDDVLPLLTLNVTPAASAVPGVTNSATVSSDDDSNEANDVAEDPTDVREPQPDLTISKSHQGNFTAEAQGTYTIAVRNLTDERADGPTVVTDTLPAGLTYVNGTGTGWSCGALGQNVTCQSNATIEGLASAPPISLVAAAGVGTQGIVTNTASLANANDTNSANNSASDPTRIDPKAKLPTALDAAEHRAEGQDHRQHPPARRHPRRRGPAHEQRRPGRRQGGRVPHHQRRGAVPGDDERQRHRRLSAAPHDPGAGAAESPLHGQLRG